MAAGSARQTAFLPEFLLEPLQRRHIARLDIRQSTPDPNQRKDLIDGVQPYPFAPIDLILRFLDLATQAVEFGLITWGESFSGRD